ncbi:MAG: hypothetical protein MAG795_00719 [Candidatus Woesearchaeota archaeon]|nr:hypothetical protein [Candidatus Woesearchaeota archaeon]
MKQKIQCNKGKCIDQTEIITKMDKVFDRDPIINEIDKELFQKMVYY